MLILGESEEECTNMKNNVDLAIKETGKHIKVTPSTDKELRLSYGAVATPALVLTEHKLKVQGEIPKVEIIREWLKNI